MLEKLRSIMEGRNGVDRLATVFFAGGFIVNMFARFLGPAPIFIAACFFIMALRRVFSKNVAKRREENYRFIRIWGDLHEEFQGWRSRRRQSREYKFFTCPGCKCRLRVKKGKGKIQITCPRCGLRFGGKT